MKNEYEIRGEVTAIIINSPKYGRQEALISTNKLDRAKEFEGTWYGRFLKNVNGFYVKGSMPQINGDRSTAIFHRWLTNAPIGMVVDHINHDGLINTDDNLRVCTNADNLQNRYGAQRNSKSGIRGVCWSKQAGKWIVQVRVKGKTIHLGYFSDILEAERAAIEARAEHMPYSIESKRMVI